MFYPNILYQLVHYSMTLKRDADDTKTETSHVMAYDVLDELNVKIDLLGFFFKGIIYEI